MSAEAIGEALCLLEKHSCLSADSVAAIGDATNDDTLKLIVVPVEAITGQSLGHENSLPITLTAPNGKFINIIYWYEDKEEVE